MQLKCFIFIKFKFHFSTKMPQLLSETGRLFFIKVVVAKYKKEKTRYFPEKYLEMHL